MIRESTYFRLIFSLFSAGLLWFLGAGLAHGQFTQNIDKIRVDPSSFPPEIQTDYHLFRKKCSECHGLDTSLKLSLPPSGWTSEVERMEAMPSSQFNDKQATAITAFLNYYGAHRNLQGSNAVAAAATSEAVAAGRKFYFAQSCDACHTIAGQGGSVGPDLTDVGSRLSQDKLIDIIQSIRSGKNTTMPQLPAGTTDAQVNDLLEFLSTLKKP